MLVSGRPVDLVFLPFFDFFVFLDFLDFLPFLSSSVESSPTTAALVVW